MHVETLQPGRGRCHVCLPRDSVLCGMLAGQGSSRWDRAVLLGDSAGVPPAGRGVMLKPAPSEGPHAETSLRRVGDQGTGPREAKTGSGRPCVLVGQGVGHGERVCKENPQ